LPSEGSRGISWCRSRSSAVLAAELASRLEVLAQLHPLGVGAQDGRQLGVPLPEPPCQRLVGVHRGIGQPPLDLSVFGSELRDGFEQGGLLGW
jgi:hypothetical protein